MKKWIKTVLILVAILVVVIGGITGYGAYKANKELNAKYDVYPSLAQVGVNDMGLYISASGNIVSSEEVTVNTSSYGKVISQDVIVGQKVKAGDVLAKIDGETLLDDIKTLEDEIFYKEVEIEKSVFEDDVYYIKSPIDGEVKDIKVKEDDKDTEDVDEASDIADVIEKYGYLALISPDDLMYAVTEESADFLKVGTEVKVSRYDYEYDGVVEKVEDGKTYVLVYNDNISIGGRVNIYIDGSNDKVKGNVELYEWVEVDVPVEEGEISQVYAYNNKTVEKGDRLFKITARSQDMIDLYTSLEDLKEDLAEKQEMLNTLAVTSPVDGIITAINIVDGQVVEDEQAAYTIADTSVWVVKVDVDELDINMIELGMKAEVSVDAYNDSLFEGTVSAISSVGTASSGVTSYEVYVEVKDNDVFKLNMTANAEIQADFIPNAMTVPAEAVREINGKSYVVVYTNPTQEEVEATKAELMQAEVSMQNAAVDFKNMSDEDIAVLKDKTKSQREPGDKPDGSKGVPGVDGFAANAITSQLSIADNIYGVPVEVEVGLINETYAQILSGLNEGDSVILPSTTGGIQDSSFSGMGFPGMTGGGGKR